jgi:hypothetical protein
MTANGFQCRFVVSAIVSAYDRGRGFIYWARTGPPAAGVVPMLKSIKPGVHFLGVRSSKADRDRTCFLSSGSVLHNSLTTLRIARSWLTRAHLASFSASSLARLPFEARRRRR